MIFGIYGIILRGIQVNGQKINCISVLGNYVLSQPLLSNLASDLIRYTMVLIPSSRDQALCHRHSAFGFSSQGSLTPKKPTPVGVGFFWS